VQITQIWTNGEKNKVIYVDNDSKITFRDMEGGILPPDIQPGSNSEVFCTVGSET
jgi:hypothetical protein